MVRALTSFNKRSEGASSGTELPPPRLGRVKVVVLHQGSDTDLQKLGTLTHEEGGGPKGTLIETRDEKTVASIPKRSIH